MAFQPENGNQFEVSGLSRAAPVVTGFTARQMIEQERAMRRQEEANLAEANRGITAYRPSMENPYGTNMQDFANSLSTQDTVEHVAIKSDIDELRERMASAEGILNSLVVQMEGAQEAIRMIAELIEGKIPEEEKRQRKTND